MRLSVVMAVRDGEPYLSDAIESVLGQTIADFEFIIVDDASRDGTAAILRHYQRQDARIRVLRNDVCQGPYPSANRAIIEARGEFLARQDADDVSPSNRFEIQLAALASGDDVVLATGVVEMFGDRRGRISPPAWQPRLEWELLFQNAIGAGAHVMFRRVLAGQPVLFAERFRYAEDYALWCALSRRGRIVCPDQTVYHYRQHAASISQSQRAEQDDCLATMRREYQAEYVPTGRALSASVARYWMVSGERSVGSELKAVDAALGRLRDRFLEYVERRYGLVDRSRLDRDLRCATRQRLAYWLYRSLRRRDQTAFGDALALAIERRQIFNVSGGAARLAANSAFARFAQLGRRFSSG
jgi:glycosyltransferase involved in cell wall biosynthesis